MKAQNGGMLGVDRVGDRGSCAILTQNFLRKRRPKDKKGRNRGFSAFFGRDLRGRSGGAHSFLAERCSERPGAVKGAPGRERSGP